MTNLNLNICSQRPHHYRTTTHRGSQKANIKKEDAVIYRYDIINMPSSIRHYQYDIINMTSNKVKWKKSHKDKQHEWKVNFAKLCVFSFLLFQIQWSLFLLPQIYSGSNYQAITSFSSCSYCSFLRPMVTHKLWTNVRFFADLSRQKALQL